jgi:3-hydroxyisobutyrate dehydrogenase-like beta-hydroxyacid dehydrogenase
MVGGTDQQYARVVPLLFAISPNKVYVGPFGRVIR